MNTRQLEKRVERLEDEFQQLKAGLVCATGKGWRAVVGTHEGSPTFDSVVKEMGRLRRDDYQDAAKEAGDSQE
jgi:hypothetical protein